MREIKNGQKTGKFCGKCGRETNYVLGATRKAMFEECPKWGTLFGGYDHTMEFVLWVNEDDYNEYDRKTGKRNSL